MKTIKNMWAMSPGLTVFTLIMAVVVLGILVMIWWTPVMFGYPFYAILVNLAVTVLAGYATWAIADIVNG